MRVVRVGALPENFCNISCNVSDEMTAAPKLISKEKLPLKFSVAVTVTASVASLRPEGVRRKPK